MLITNRLRLRPVCAADAEVLYELRRLVAAYQGRTSRSLAETRAMYAAMAARTPGAAAGWHQYVVTMRDGGATLGDIGVNFAGPGDEQAEIGYSIHPDHWGLGYGCEAVARMLDHLFTDHALHRVVAVTGAGNGRSRALLDRLGFRQEARYLEAFFDPELGCWADDVGYAVLAREWRGAA